MPDGSGIAAVKVSEGDGHMAFALNIGKCSLLGNYRENNEDSVDVKQFPDLTVCVVADGMGGQAAGEIASKKAIEIIPRELRKNLATNLNTEAVKTTTKRAIVQANEEIMAMGALDKDLKNMGTTVVMAIWRKGPEVYVAGVGDSRCYLVRSKAITDGVARKIAKGDVIVVPPGTPHWFSAIDGTITYLESRVRVK